MDTFIGAAGVGFCFGVVFALLFRFAAGPKCHPWVMWGIIGMLFTAPWWAALAGAVAGHAFATLAYRAFDKEVFSKRILRVGLGAIAGYATVCFMLLLSAMTDVLQFAKVENDQHWRQFEGRSEVHAFVATHYRTCVDLKDYAFRRTTQRYDANTCKAITLMAAREVGGERFVSKVEAAITDWQTVDSLPSAELIAMIEKIESLK